MTTSKKTKMTLLITILILILLLIHFYIYIKKKYNISEDCNCSITNIQNNNIEQLKNTNNKHKLCLYYSNHCGHCHHFLPEWKKLKEHIEKSNLNNIIELSDIDCNTDKSVCVQNNIYGVPTVILHKLNKTNLTYEGSRDMNGLLEFIEKNKN